ncbi:hypothetical protein J6590_037896 [Homalodisca vitripennis]|nr:hypothetical protein J6590_096862 [Homalodisca vitripennis]KAG8272602.1 hypothetical protein J6590_037896 [Homalodisca vitripennis]
MIVNVIPTFQDRLATRRSSSSSTVCHVTSERSCPSLAGTGLVATVSARSVRIQCMWKDSLFRDFMKSRLETVDYLSQDSPRRRIYRNGVAASQLMLQLNRRLSNP